MSVDTTKSTYNILASSDDATVVSEYIPSASKSDQYLHANAIAYRSCLGGRWSFDG